MGYIKRIINHYFYLDLRSLAVVRIGTAGVLLADIIDRSRDLTALYTDNGVLPITALKDYPLIWWLPIHNLNGSFEFQAVLFVTQAFFALTLLVGFKTTLSTIVSWILLNSLQSRNPLLFYGADQTLRMLIFWGMFLPWQAKWSLDSLKNNMGVGGNRFVSAATLAYILQIVFIYVFAALLKSDPIWRVEGTAVYYALSLDVFRSSLGNILYSWPLLHKPLTFLVFIQEALGTFLLFLPFKKDLMRIIVIILFIGLHLGFGLTMHLGIFPWVSSIFWLALLPTSFWEYLEFKTKRVWSMIKYPSGALLKRNLNTKPTLPFYKSVLLNSAVIFFLTICLVLNLTSLPNLKRFLPEPVRVLGLRLGIYQQWRIFAPRPSFINGWYVVKGTLQDNTVFDLYNNTKGISFKKPPSIADTYQSSRWLIYLRNISGSRMKKYVPYYSQYLCNTWNANHVDNKKVNIVEVWFVAKFSQLDYQYETEKFLLDQTKCTINRSDPV